VDLIKRIPSDLKGREGCSKLVLKEAMRGLLPDSTLQRRKQGFTPPDQSWYKESAAGYIRDLILSPRALDRGYFQAGYLENILDDHMSDRRNNRFLIWSLMSFEWWNRLFLDREPLPEIPQPQTEEHG
jgi:asparagine synthase (glutamine-hydrolysing)